MFLFKKKKRVIDAFTYDGAAHDLYPIAPSKEYYPKTLLKGPGIAERPSRTGGSSIQLGTLRTCAGVSDLYNVGWIVPLWSDLLIELNGDGTGSAEFSNERDDITTHHPDQLGTLGEELVHIKIESPWMIVDPKGTQFLYHEASWSRYPSMGYHITQGVLEFKYNASTHFQMWFEKKQQRLQIQAGTPMAQLVPISDDDIEIKTHHISRDEHHRLYNKTGGRYMSSFAGGYLKARKRLQSKGTCPYSN